MIVLHVQRVWFAGTRMYTQILRVCSGGNVIVFKYLNFIKLYYIYNKIYHEIFSIPRLNNS